MYLVCTLFKKAVEKHSLGHSEAGAQNHSTSTPWGTFWPGPLSTPVNGQDRNLRAQRLKKWTFFIFLWSGARKREEASEEVAGGQFL